MKSLVQYMDIGAVYGRLTLISKDGKKLGVTQFFTFRCSCGVVKDIRPYSVLKGTTASCGCYNSEVARRSDNKFRKPEGDAAARSLLGNYRTGARNRGHAFQLSFEEFKDITKQDCAYCGVEPSNYTKHGMNLNGQYLHNGIDRVDNSEGYTLSNCVPCCKLCNMAKGTMSLKDFKDFISRVHEHLGL